MKKLLVYNCEILAAVPSEEFQDMEDRIIASGVEFPKSTMEGYQISEVEDSNLPVDFSAKAYQCIDNQLVLSTPVDPRNFSTAEKEEKRNRIQEEINRLERESLLNRGSRELDLAVMEDKAQVLATERGVTVEEVLATVPYYVKLKALDNQIYQLRVAIYDMGFTS